MAVTVLTACLVASPSPTRPARAPTGSQVLHTTHDWALVFEVAAGLYALGALAYLRYASCEEQFTAPASPEAQ